MKKYVLLLSLLLLGPKAALAENLPERLSAVRAELLASEPVATYDFRQLQSQYPDALILHESLLPQSADYPLKSLQRLYKSSLSCKGPWPVTPLLTQPLVFTRAICNNTVLPIGWFTRAGISILAVVAMRSVICKSIRICSKNSIRFCIFRSENSRLPIPFSGVYSA
ncbi:signal transduction histidine kinase [Photobacterium aphoticum]|uniref:Signal transduction histidine kinase n=1 Tax=Photobacterium aphoticum TaxID=754436 RepID=A0A090R5K7_9GAMM|nr:signal transduction histidine kinase [Photobacterium aphoticum]